MITPSDGVTYGPEEIRRPVVIWIEDPLAREVLVGVLKEIEVEQRVPRVCLKTLQPAG